MKVVEISVRSPTASSATALRRLVSARVSISEGRKLKCQGERVALPINRLLTKKFILTRGYVPEADTTAEIRSEDVYIEPVGGLRKESFGASEGPCNGSFSFGITASVSLNIPFSAAHFCTAYSHDLNWGSASGCPGLPALGLFLSTQYKIEWMFLTTRSSRVSAGGNSVASFPESLSIK